jgi:hypothetical protein
MNAQHLSLFARRYRSKLCLFYLLWSYSPSYSSPQGVITASADANSTLLSLTLSSSGTVSPSSPLPLSAIATAGVGTPPGVTVSSLSSLPQEVERPQKRQVEGFLTPSDALDVDSRETARPVVGSTSEKVLTVGGNTTPPLSSPPSPQASSSPAPSSIPLDPPPPPNSSPSFPPVSQPHSFTPFTFTLLILHLLFLFQFLALPLGDEVVRRLLSSPLPASFCDTKKGGKGAGVKKRWSRVCWRTKNVWTSCGEPVVALVCLIGVVLGTVVFAVAPPAAVSAEGSKLVGWNAAPLASLWTGENGGAALKLAEGFAATSEAARVLGKVGGPWKWVVGFEVRFLLISLSVFPFFRFRLTPASPYPNRSL